ncbi:choline/ethanolamine kinase family protein [Arenibacterium halophilum]|uniref:Phosphotransferase family protein n=1 Tax=Arenibacterium halophilum TaxID=2583821 RepID=A0ABY2X8C1_9RHOB|nr:choline/ethanolamine kinase family protein [Arenibacterium halophilum]TMV12616.1 phosphotransferase family protein [Arenibacterium halophilum]
MSEKDKATIRAALARTPGYDDADPATLDIMRLGGLTNLVYRIGVPGRAPLVVRLPGAGTEDYIDRKAELVNAQAAARAGVSARILHAEPEAGILVMDAIEGVTTMTPDNFHTIPGAPARAGQVLRQLHASGEEFAARFELFAMIEDYLGVLAKKEGSTLPEGYHDVVAAAEPVRAALDANPAPLAPCHCDPLCENFLDDGTRMWVVDYEYGGMNDPLWDLGDLSVEAGMTPEMEAEMLAAYFGRAPTAAELGRVVIYKAMCDLLWTLWGLIQHADGNPAEDFWAYATGRFDRCKALMNASGFDDHVAAVRAG